MVLLPVTFCDNPYINNQKGADVANRNFMEMLRAKWAESKFVCVGLDTDSGKLPKVLGRQSMGEAILAFNLCIIEAVKDLACAFKPNSAFYEAHGENGIRALKLTCDQIRASAPDVPIILDAKRADIGNTNGGYVRFAFDYIGADAITVHPYLGQEALQPFLDRADKGVFVLCRTSNPGAGEFQDLQVELEAGYAPLYQAVADNVSTDWNVAYNCGVVVGATYPEELTEIRRIVGDLPILIPGIGAQGGDVEATVKAGMDSNGEGMIINSSRGIIFASSEADFAEVARAKTIELSDEINRHRQLAFA